MKKLKSHFSFNKQERSGIFFLLLIIVTLQALNFLIKADVFGVSETTISVDTETQSRIDELKEQQLQRDSVKLNPFNPNFISDFKGYTLGMSTEEIDRLHEFRSKNKFVNSVQEFQEVTLVSDSLLQIISSYFQFPSWTQNRRVSANDYSKKSIIVTNSIKDLNAVTAEELKTIRGIGEKLSARIIKFRTSLGGFMVNEQLYDVYGLEHDVVLSALEKFQVLEQPEIQKININEASAFEIAQLVYITSTMAKNIIRYRQSVGSIGSFSELTKIQDFPSDKIDRIKLYLTL